jgi:hypothetical protein
VEGNVRVKSLSLYYHRVLLESQWLTAMRREPVHKESGIKDASRPQGVIPP